MPAHIYVRGPNWLGDVVMATPVLRALRRRFPESRIALGLRAYARPLLAGSPLVDDLIEVPLGGGLAARLAHLKDLRAARFDLGILLTNSFGSALDLALARVPRRRGYQGDGRGLLLNEGIAPLREGRRRQPIAMTLYYQRLVEGLGCELDDGAYELPVAAADEAEASAFLARQGVTDDEILVGLNPGAKFGSSKLWLPDRFAALADRLGAQGARPVLLGGPGEEELLRSITRASTAPIVGGADDILPLGPLKALIRRLAVLVTTDTGPRAIAQAFAVPTVVLMGPTHPGWTDWNNQRARIIRRDVACGPCHKKVCDLDHRCMVGIEVDEVLRAVGGYWPT